MRKFFLIALTIFVFYGISLKYGFSQDDFYHLTISRIDSFQDFLLLFSPFHQSEWIFFRPLGTQVYYFLFDALFGWQNAALPMHIGMLTVHIITAYLVYKLFKKLNFSSAISTLSAIIYGTSALHFLSLFYIGAVQQLLATFFSLLVILFFLKKKIFWQVLFFVLALLSKELSIRLPIILFALHLFQFQGEWRKGIKRILPIVIVAALYTALRLFLSFDVPDTYQPEVNAKIITSLRWYMLFAYGLPEKILDYGIGRGGIKLGDYTNDLGLIGLLSLVGAGLAIALSLYLFWKNRKSAKTLWPLGLWFIGGVLPILFLPLHRYPHYVDLSLLALLIVLFYNLKGKLAYLLAILFMVTSLSSIIISQRTHWTTGRARIVERSHQLLQEEKACDYNTVLIDGEGNIPLEISYALMLENGPRIMCNKNHMQVYYTGVNYSGQQIEKTIHFEREILSR